MSLPANEVIAHPIRAESPMATVERIEPTTPTSTRSVHRVVPPSRVVLKFSAEMNTTLDGLMQQTRLSKAQVLSMAVGLLDMAAQATRDGKRLAILDEQGEIETEFTGL